MTDSIIRHNRVSAAADSLTRPDLIQPSDWNEDHVIDAELLREYLDVLTSSEISSLISGLVGTGVIPQASIVNLVTDLAGKQPLDADLTAIAALATTTFGRALLTLANEAALGALVNIDDLNDVDAPDPADGAALVWDEYLGKWVPGVPGFGVIEENDVGPSTNDAGNSGSAITVDWSLGRTQKIDLDDDTTITHDNMVPGVVYTLELHTGAGSFTADFDNTDWGDADPPVVTADASKMDVFTFYCAIDGAIVGGVFVQGATP